MESGTMQGRWSVELKGDNVPRLSVELKGIASKGGHKFNAREEAMQAGHQLN